MMRKTLFSVLLGLALLLPFRSEAQVSPELLKAVHLIYNVQFSQANKIIENFVKTHPDDGAGYLLRGIATEWRQFSLNKGKSLNPTIMADFQKARRIAAEKYEKNKSIENAVLLATAYVYVSKKQIDSGHSAQAGLSLKKAKNLMEPVLQKDPNNMYASFSIGIFNYFSDNVPSGFKWLAKLLGFKGDRHKGLALLKQAAKSPTLTQGDAQYMLLYILSQKEGNYPAALVYAQKLHNRYPNNPVFIFDIAEMQFRTKKIAPARKNFTKFISYCEKNKGRCSQDFRYLSNYFMTWSYIDEKDYNNAKIYLEKAKELDNKRYKDRTSDLKKWTKLVD